MDELRNLTAADVHSVAHKYFQQIHFVYLGGHNAGEAVGFQRILRFRHTTARISKHL